MTSLDEMTEAALAQIAAAKTKEEAQQIASTFRAEGQHSLQAWRDGEDVAVAPVRALTIVYRDLTDKGTEPDEALAKAIERVNTAANARRS